jgi:MOSC domain-containing protein YiiM
MAADEQIGRVEHIHLTGRAGEPMRAIHRIRLIAGIGLDGDRYATGLGEFSKHLGTGRALTLIEAEVLDALRASLGIDLQPGEARRNVTTRGIALNALVGQRFRIGGVLCEAARLCEPCQYLEDLLVKPVRHPLLHRGGLRADVLEDGEIRIGDEVRAVRN